MKNDPDFAGKKINIVGISQGGLIARSIVEQCEGLDVHTLFTYGGPHQGVSDIPENLGKWYSKPLNWAAGYVSQYLIAQNWVAPADYYRTWWNLDRYFENSIFLPYDNNEKESAEQSEQKARILSLTNFGMFKWQDDRTVIPKESEWFGYYNKFHQVVPFKKTDDYKNDYLGLRTLDEAGNLFFYSGSGDHMYLIPDYINNFLIPLITDQDPTPTEY